MCRHKPGLGRQLGSPVGGFSSGGDLEEPGGHQGGGTRRQSLDCKPSTKARGFVLLDDVSPRHPEHAGSTFVAHRKPSINI